MNGMENMNKDKEKFWDTLREPSTHTCNNCSHMMDAGPSLGMECSLHVKYTCVRAISGIPPREIRRAADHWHWDGENE